MKRRLFVAILATALVWSPVTIMAADDTAAEAVTEETSGVELNELSDEQIVALLERSKSGGNESRN